MQQVEYIDSLKREVVHYRNMCFHHMTSVYNVVVDQTTIRQASWAYARRFGTITPEHLTFTWPANVGSSYTDTFHHSHFIRAVLASIFCPEEPLTDEVTEAPNICQVANNDLERREAQVLLYQALAQLLPQPVEETTQDSQPPKKARIKSWKQRISDDISHIKQCIDEIHKQTCLTKPEVHLNEQPEKQDVDKKPSRRSKLPAKK